jgi:hypothetical protein
LGCSYEDARCIEPHRYDCAEGQWRYTPPALESCDSPPPPQLGERCRTPFAGARAGTVAVRILGDRFVWGSQGTAMIDFELELGGDAATLACVHVSLTVTVGAEAPFMGAPDMRLRCGSTRSYMPILSGDVALAGSYPVTLTVDVQGVGTATSSAVLLGGR